MTAPVRFEIVQRAASLAAIVVAGGVMLLSSAGPAGPIGSGPTVSTIPLAQMESGKPGVSLVSLREMVGMQANGKVPGTSYRGDDSCRWANDGECDDVGLGTGACRAGTDYSDCRRIAAGVEDNSCRWANDGECDEPHYGTGACTQGTDRNDCGPLNLFRFQTDDCAIAFNGICNEPGIGDSACPARTDRADCIGRDRPMEINDHFFGRDDRVLVDTAVAPWSAIGFIEMDADGAGCTATLVAADVLVTAAHCIETDTGIDARGVFEVGADLPGGVQTARVVAYLLSQHRSDGSKTADESETDWALLRIDRSLGDSVGTVGVRSLADYSPNQALLLPILQAGYSWDTGDHLSGNLDCRVIDLIGESMIHHSCDTTRGDSGSPLMIRDGGRYFIIATDSAFDVVPNEPAAYVATRADEWMALLADFAAGRSGVAVQALPQK